jgi:peptide alpha-N-acetyltransferase
MAAPDGPDGQTGDSAFHLIQYESERQLPEIMALIDAELSEPYSIFTYRYFLSQWPFLCHVAVDDATGEYFGCIIGKMERHPCKGIEVEGRMRGYIGMLTVTKQHRKKGVGSGLVKSVIREMIRRGCQEICLEAEVTNAGALKLYERLGFIRDKRLRRYYLNGSDAHRLKLLVDRQTHVDSPTADAKALFSNLYL